MKDKKGQRAEGRGQKVRKMGEMRKIGKKIHTPHPTPHTPFQNSKLKTQNS
ncbi:hypothetical protein K9N68_28375 [Kovacikia minuta CCNUW1]|uniref:hypothetical protein n=1 Tax=Kovacikia minuta TaxID=2931930 RepID=UPI001CCC87BA|nr:hypothetical protein [Kovacikia minuta]UBF25462.1 hypothetical protein K9N68_28375 [Kovacikia minuta CCNUW1]